MKINTSTFSQKWGDSPFSRHHTQVSNLMIRYQVRLGLTTGECWLITVISQFKHDARNPYPSQDLIGKLMGCTRSAVLKNVKSIEKKGLVALSEKKFANNEYDFRHLVAAVNECFYEDHPEERPPLPVAMAQCGFAPEEECVYKERLVTWRSMRNIFRTEDQPHGAQSARREVSTKRHIGISQEELDSNLEEDEVTNPNQTLNVGDLFETASVEDVVKLTKDEKSRRRFTQIYSIATEKGVVDTWNHAYVTTRERMEKLPPLENPGKYFNGLVVKLLRKRKVDVPGSLADRAEVAAALPGIRAHLGLDKEGGE